MAIPLSKFNEAVGTRLVLRPHPETQEMEVVAGDFEGRNAHFNHEDALIENAEIRQALRQSMQDAYGEDVTRIVIRNAKRTNLWDRSRPLGDMDVRSITDNAERSRNAILRHVDYTRGETLGFLINNAAWTEDSLAYSAHVETILPQNVTFDIIFARERHQNYWLHLDDQDVHNPELAELFIRKVEKNPHFGWIHLTSEEYIDHAKDAVRQFAQIKSHRHLVASEISRFLTPRGLGLNPLHDESTWSQLPEYDVRFDTVFRNLRSDDTDRQLSILADSDVDNPELHELFRREVKNDQRFGRERLSTDDYVELAQTAIFKFAQSRQAQLLDRTIAEAEDFVIAHEWGPNPYIDDETLANLPDKDITLDVIFVHGRSQHQAWPELTVADTDSHPLVDLFFSRVQNDPRFGQIPMTKESYINHAKTALGLFNAMLKVQRKTGPSSAA